MKVLTFEQFLELPVGTIYSDWVPDQATGLMRKGETLLSDGKPFDFVTTDLLPSCYGGANDNQPFLDEDGGAREGLYDHEALYCVWEPMDVARPHRMLGT